MKKTVSFQEYEAAKAEIIQGVEFKEYTALKDYKICKIYATKKNGVFYEILENGIVEFWSDKHYESRYFDDRTREEIIEQYEKSLDAKDKLISIITENNKALRAYPGIRPGWTGMICRQTITAQAKCSNAK